MSGKPGRIGVGVVGAGGIVRDRHVPGFKRIPGVELVGVVNRSAESSRRAMAEHGFQRTYRHWRELLADPQVDAVVIATWPYLHAPITLAALDAGKHVLSQARMAMDGAEARAMLAASRAHPELVTMVVPSPYTLWADRTVQRLLREQAVGELRSVRAFWPAGPRDPEQRLHWRHDRQLSGNNVMALGIEYEAMARWLGHAVAAQATSHVFDPIKAAPDGSRAISAIPDHVALVAEFPGPVFATLEMSVHAAHEATSVLFFGTGGTVRLKPSPRSSLPLAPMDSSRSSSAQARHRTGASRRRSSRRSGARVKSTSQISQRAPHTWRSRTRSGSPRTPGGGSRFRACCRNR